MRENPESTDNTNRSPVVNNISTSTIYRTLFLLAALAQPACKDDKTEGELQAARERIAALEARIDERRNQQSQDPKPIDTAVARILEEGSSRLAEAIDAKKRPIRVPEAETLGANPSEAEYFQLHIRVYAKLLDNLRLGKQKFLDKIAEIEHLFREKAIENQRMQERRVKLEREFNHAVRNYHENLGSIFHKGDLQEIGYKERIERLRAELRSLPNVDQDITVEDTIWNRGRGSARAYLVSLRSGLEWYSEREAFYSEQLARSRYWLERSKPVDAETSESNKSGCSCAAPGSEPGPTQQSLALGSIILGTANLFRRSRKK